MHQALFAEITVRKLSNLLFPKVYRQVEGIRWGFGVALLGIWNYTNHSVRNYRLIAQCHAELLPLSLPRLALRQRKPT